MKKLRAGAWVILLALAGAQAWSSRFYATPDGVSYMDLSDAVQTGQWRELLNGYWSPLYPVLIGLLRAVLRPTAYWEFGVAHLLNFFLFAASLLGFEYFVAALRELGRAHWSKPGLDNRWGTIGSYAVFGVFTLMMTPLTLPTPDLLVSAASLFVFGALLRLRYDLSPARSGLVLGVALAAGSLAKSFFIPWAGFCLVTTAFALRGRAMRPLGTSTAIWLLAVIPWTIGLSSKYGHLTFGDTGRLTYVWYVNRVETPSAKLMPHAAGSPATDAILSGIAITPDAPGTNQVWYDPARWYGDLHPTFDLARQLTVFGLLISEYIASLAPMFIVMAFWLIVAGRAAVTEWWLRTWSVVAPALAALAAYSIVLVTTRYVAPFYMALLLTVMCGARWPDSIPPMRMVVAIGVPLILMVATPNPGQPMALINAAAGSVLFVWLARNRPPVMQAAFGLIGGLAIRVLQPGSDLRYVMPMSVGLILCYWIMARVAEARGEQMVTSLLTRRALVAANAILVLFVGGLKYKDSLTREPLDDREPNDVWSMTHLAAQAGVPAHPRIALVGSPFELYWARAMRGKIVAVVPPPRMTSLFDLSPLDRRSLYDQFAKAGANVVIIQRANAPEGADRSWVPMSNIGWVRALPYQ